MKAEFCAVIMVRRLRRQMVSKKIVNKNGGLRWCSFANSVMPKANTGWRHRANPAIPCLLRFNHLRDPAGLARQVRLVMAGTNSKKLGFPIET
jgi:hypothetical protein